MRRTRRPTAALVPGLSLLLALFLAACNGSTTGARPAPEPEPEPEPPAPTSPVPSRGASTTLDVAGWNLEWFGSTEQGPADEALQMRNVRDVILGTGFDVWGLAEVTSQAAFDQLEAQLTGYTGFLAGESSVAGGPAAYAADEQKIGILYRSDVATLVSARIILAAQDYVFAGRPPLEVKLRVSLNGTTEEVVFVVVHLKAFDDLTSWTRRRDAAAALKGYLDATYPTQKVMVVGDWNDDTDVSITAGQPTPFQAFLGDSARYRFTTAPVSAAGFGSTTRYPSLIDHHLVTNELAAAHVRGSTEVYRVDGYIANYDASTSDHFPVLSRFTVGTAAGASGVTLTSPAGGETWTGGSTRNVTWTATGVTNVRLEYTLDGAAWSVLAPSTPATAGTYAWTLPNVSTAAARVRVSSATGPSLGDIGAPFSVAGSSAVAQVILNEILANEPGADPAGEFVEIVNVGGTAASLAGWTLSDAAGVKHTFAAGTTLAPGKAIVVFGGAGAIPGGLTNAVAASTGGLALANGGDSVILRDAGGATLASFTYPAALASVDGVSMNRSPDVGATGPFVLHNTLASAPSSPGRRANGAAF